MTEAQEKWLTALESGEWRQCRNTLANDKGEHCCLGVACVVNGIEIPEDHGEAYTWLNTEFGLRSMMGEFAEVHFIDSERIRTLTDLNDWYEYTFPQIAAFIRANPTLIFRDL